ncbi:nucleotide sugar dehydrogenase [Porticoccaceae bacterium]|nr:nucleotide sugar dehydrogenase [Porticoccaceae bacterium]
MKIAIIGLGYVGITSAAGLLELGHQIVGYEKNTAKVETLRNGLFPIIEPKISGLFKKHIDRFTILSSLDVTLNTCDCVMVAVGTPTDETGMTSLTAMDSVVECLAEIVNNDVPIVLRSTIPIGTSRNYAEKYPCLNIVFHPEFLREGSAINDFFNPPKLVFGVDGEVADDLVGILSNIYPEFSSPTFYVTYESAESVKYADNIFHALKVAFTNEIVKAVTKKGADPFDVMSIFCADTQLNISPVYLKPGFAYGGSCLEKDLYSFRHQNSDCKLPLLDSITVSNEYVIADFYQKIKGLTDTFVINGLTFKEGIDDLRRSPFVALTKMLLQQGSKVYAYDDNLRNVFGESLDILNGLQDFSNFSLNRKISISADEVLVIYSHKEKHCELDEMYLPDFDLFIGGEIAKVYS